MPPRPPGILETSLSLEGPARADVVGDAASRGPVAQDDELAAVLAHVADLGSRRFARQRHCGDHETRHGRKPNVPEASIPHTWLDDRLVGTVLHTQGWLRRRSWRTVTPPRWDKALNERTGALTIAQLRLVVTPPGVSVRQGASVFAPAPIPDLIGVRDRRYLGGCARRHAPSLE